MTDLLSKEEMDDMGLDTEQVIINVHLQVIYLLMRFF